MNARPNSAPEMRTPTASATEPGRWNGAALTGLSLAMQLPSLATSVANMALPVLARSFSISFQAAQWIVLTYLLATTILVIAAGRLGDILGRRRLLLAGMALFTLASALCGAAPAFWLLIGARAMQGLGAAIMMALAIAFVGDIVPKEKLGSAVGVLGAMSAIGTTLGPSLGGLLIMAFGWRAIFTVNLPLGIVAFALLYRSLPSDERPVAPAAREFDGLGLALLLVTLGAYALAMTAGDLFGAPTLALLSIALGAGVAFLAVESTARSPLIQLEMFRNPVLAGGLVANGLVSTVMMTTLVVGPFYLSQALGLEHALVGIAMSIGPLAAALSGLPAGRLVDSFGPEAVRIAGLVGMAAGSLLLSVMPAAAGIPGYILPIMALTVGYAMFQAANTTAIMAGAPLGQRGVISAMLNVSRNLGLVTGASAMGAIFAFGTATNDIVTARPEEIADGMRMTFAVASGLTIMALAIIVRRTISGETRTGA